MITLFAAVFYLYLHTSDKINFMENNNDKSVLLRSNSTIKFRGLQTRICSNGNHSDFLVLVDLCFLHQTFN